MWKYKAKNAYPSIRLDGSQIEKMEYRNDSVILYIPNGFWIRANCHGNRQEEDVKTGPSCLVLYKCQNADMMAYRKWYVSKYSQIILERYLKLWKTMKRLNSPRWDLFVMEETSIISETLAIRGELVSKKASEYGDLEIRCEEMRYYWNELRKPTAADYRYIDVLWLRSFASEVLKGTLRIHVTADCNYLWHIFSFCLVPSYSGAEAQEMFNKLDYTEVILFTGGQWWEGKAEIENLRLIPKISASILDIYELKDIYIVDKNFRWTYVHTHESMCGPYFCYGKGIYDMD